MSIFKCKMCGGTIEFEQGATVGVCDSCGTKQTLPRLDDDRRANLYDRANHFRRNNEFDKASGIYEQILTEDTTDAEAYWSLVLCQYGIEYVEDPATRKRVPTVNRAQFTSIFDDDNYKSALQYADGYQRELYEKEAKEINEIQKGILAISQKEEPFDVFICYKETDQNGRRTPDSVLATDLYHQLTQEGFKVFFSRFTLEDKLGTAYEPYIFAALNSAKVMVVLGTKPEYFNAVWVKNEWSRYLALVKKSGGKKILIPAYKDMDPYDLPEEFSHLQAQDMSKLGFMQDLIRGIKKIAKTDEPKAPAKEAVVVNSTANAGIAPLLQRAFMFLEDGEFDRADELCEQVLNANPTNAEAYICKILVENQCTSKSALLNSARSIKNSKHYEKVYRFGNEEQKAYLENVAAAAERGRKLYEAIKNGNAAAVAQLLSEGADPNGVRRGDDTFYSVYDYDESYSGTEFSALRDSIRETKNDEIAELLINAGADVDYLQELGNVLCPVLNSAIMNNKTRIVKLMLEKGADPNCERIFDDGRRFSALRDSISEAKNDEIAEQLINAGADVNYVQKNNEALCPVLISAILQGNTRIVKLMLEKGADPNCKRIFDDGRRFSALRDSISEVKNVEIAELLINAGADLNCLQIAKAGNCEVRFMPLNSAVLEGNKRMVKLLLEKGADPNCKRRFDDGRTYSALHDSINRKMWDITGMLAARMKAAPDDAKNLKLSRDNFSPECVKKLKEIGCKFKLF